MSRKIEKVQSPMEENYQQNPDANMNEDGDGDQGEENHFFEGNRLLSR
jgi:hypothetical protein